MFSTGKRLSLSLYIIGVAVIFLAVYVPYFVPLGEIGGYLVVYGLPAVVVSLFFGKQIVSRAFKNNVEAFKLSLGSFGAFYLIGLFLATAFLVLLLQFDPSAAELIQKPNPALDVAPNIAWLMMAFSMLVIGPAEEYLFRGFMFGGLLSVSKGRHWILLAVVSSLIFALAHGYYVLVYEVASPVFFIQLTCFGIAMSLAYYWSGGNLLAPIVIHGLNDAIGFLGVATSRTVALTAQIIFIAVCLTFAIFYVLRKKVLISSAKPPQTSPQPTQPPPPSAA
jgi:membrane protease YdiL (CAAX protease family)